MSSMLKQLTHD
jgi:hypothetical protein